MLPVVAVVVVDLLDVRAAGLAVRAPVVLVLLVEAVQPGPGGYRARALGGQVDAGLLAEAPAQLHLLHFLHRRPGAGHDVGLAVVVLPDVVGQLVEHRVAGHHQGLVETDVAGAGEVVVEHRAADGQRAGAAVQAVQRVAGRDRGRGRGHLPGRPGRVLALGDPVQDRLGVPGPEQRGELLLGDAAGPHRRVVGRVAGHRDHPAGGGHHHRGAGGGAGVAGRLGLADGGGQRVLGELLDLRVEAGDQGVAGDRCGPPDGPGDVARGVDRDLLAARPGRAARGRTAARARTGRPGRRRRSRSRSGAAGPPAAG